MKKLNGLMVILWASLPVIFWSAQHGIAAIPTGIGCLSFSFLLWYTGKKVVELAENNNYDNFRTSFSFIAPLCLGGVIGIILTKLL